ncbi:Phospholipase A-2-activating protein, partial [Trichinella pseudospiralis]
LPQAYLNDVVNFIEKNTVRNEQPRPAPGNFDQDGSDPLTGAARYVPMQNVVEKLDPLKPVGDDIPLRRYQVVDNFSAKQLSNKLKEFNEAVLEEDRIRSSEMDSLEKLLSTKPCKPNRDHLLLVEKMLCWPTEHLVPVIDLLRLVILDGAGCEAFFVNADRHLLSFSCSLVADKHSANYSQFQTVVCRLFEMCIRDSQEVIDIDKASGDGVDEPLEVLGRVAQAERHLEELEKAEECCDHGLQYVLRPHQNVLTRVPLIACNIGSLDAGGTCCFSDVVAGSKLTAAPMLINKRGIDILPVVYRQRLKISGKTTAVSVECRCRFPTDRVGRTSGLSPKRR